MSMKTLNRIYLSLKAHRFFWLPVLMIIFNAIFVISGFAHHDNVDVVMGSFFIGVFFDIILEEIIEDIVDMEIKDMN